MAEQKQSPPPNPTAKTPKLQAPDGACDCHLHIWGPQHEVPLRADFPLKFHDALMESYIAMADTIGLSRAVIVQSIPQGHDHRVLLRCLRAQPDRFRGVAVPAPDASDDALDELHDAGCRGIRVAYTFSPEMPIKMIERVAARGWHAQIVGQPDQLAEWHDAMLSLPCDIVIDHMGLPAAVDGVNSAHFNRVLAMVERPNVWIKLSGMDKVSSDHLAPWLDTVPFAQALFGVAPDRCVWGTDWPHPGTFHPMPNEGDQLDVLLDWLLNEADRHKVLVDNPARLYDFPQP
ncbi:MAG: amidohydrolase family protein [Alphaproteobacteria bacterium]|nr:amidohydrolase family protein [Alphaproteobacteria bacterium]